jgi:hypothetical protein
MASKKSKRAWLYISEEDQPRLEELLRSVGGSFNEVTVLSALASAGLKACEDIGYRLPLPLVFSVQESKNRKS